MYSSKGGIHYHMGLRELSVPILGCVGCEVDEDWLKDDDRTFTMLEPELGRIDADTLPIGSLLGSQHSPVPYLTNGHFRA